MLKKKLKHGTMMNSFHKTSILCLLTIILSTASPITVYADNITSMEPESDIILEDTYDCSEVVIPEPELEEGIPETAKGTPITEIEIEYSDVQHYQSSYGISTFSMRSSGIIGSWEIGNPVASDVVATLYSNGLLEFAGTGDTIAYTESTGTGDTIAYDEISGTIPWLQYKDLILDYYIEDTVRPTSTSFWFYDCQNLQYIHEFPDSVYYTQFMFYNCKNITGNIPSFAALGKVIATNSMFNGCTGLTGTIPSFEYFGNVVDAEFMFHGCSGLTGAIPSFSAMTKVEDIRYMFKACSGLTSFTDLDGLISCEDMTETFNECEGLTGSIPDFDDLGNVKYMNATFRSLRNIDGQIPDFAPLVSVENMNATFTYDHKLKGPIRNISAMTNITNFANCFIQCGSLDGEIPDFGYLPNLTDTYTMFSSCGELTGDIPDLSGLPKLDRARMMFINCGNLDGDIGDISGLTSLRDAGYMFHGCGKLVGNVPDLSNLTKLNNTDYMFSGCGNLTGEIPNLDSLVNVTNTKYMFSGCSKLTGSTPNLDKLTKLKDASRMFANCGNLDGTIGEFGTLPNLTSIEGMFYYCGKLKGHIPSFDGLTSLQAMHHAFMYCTNITGSIPSFDKLTNLVNMNSTFYCCYSLTGEIPDMSSLTKVQYINQTFTECCNLTGSIPDLSHFTDVKYCNAMFNGCTGLTGSIPDLSALGTATLCGGMFDGCTGLTGEIPDLSGFTKTTSLDKMFYNCPGLTEVGEDFAIPSNITSMDKAFYCPNTTYTKFKTKDPIALAYDWEADNRMPLNAVASWQIGSPNIEDVEATLYSNGLLEFTGVGNTLWWEDETLIPWHEYRESIIEYSIKDTVRPTSMVLWFKDCVNLKHIQPFPSSVQTLSSTFSGCTNLTGEIPDLSVAPHLMNIDYAFANCKNLTGNIPSLDWQTNWIRVAGAFAGCENLTGSIPSLSTLNNVEDVSNLFCKCTRLTGSIPNLDALVNAKDTSQMFMRCENLTGSIPSLDSLVNAEDTHSMFYGCEKLTGPIPSLDALINVTNLQQMFMNCYEVTGSLPSLDNLSKAENLLGMFAYCGNLTGNIPSLDSLVNAKDLAGMFAGLHYVTGEIPSFDNLTNVENCSSMFMECYSLEGPVPNLKNCTKLHTIDMMFNMCPGVAVIEEDFVLPESIESKYNVFYWYEELPIYIYTEDPNTWLYNYKGDNRTIISDVNAWYIGAPDEWKVVAILHDDGLLGFYGKGNTKQFEDTTRPWYNLKGNIIKYSIKNTVRPKSMDYWFKDCSNMKYLSYMPSSVESLNHTFSGCKSLYGEIPSLHSLTNLQSADYIFAYCENLNIVKSDFILPTNLKDSEGMFKCESFTKTKFLTEDATALSYDWEGDSRKLYKEEWNFGNVSGNFNNIDNVDIQADDNIIATVYLNEDRTYELSFEGSGSMAGFYNKDFMFWKEYLNNITNISIDDGITTIGNYVCTDCVNVGGNLIISDNILSIGKEAFANCSSITTLSYPGDINLDNEPFKGVDNLETIILTKGKTGIISYDQSSSNSPCAYNQGYSLYIDEGVTEIDSEISNSITDLHIAYTVSKLKDNSFIDANQLTLIELGYKGITDNYEEGIKAFGVNTFTGVNNTHTIIVFSTVNEYEYDWESTGRSITFNATLSALKDILLKVSEFTQHDLSEQDWNTLVNEIPNATNLIESGSTDVNAITDSFIILYNICKNRVVASFVVAVPAVVTMESDYENNIMKTEIPISVKYRFPNLNHKLEISLQDDLKLIENNTGEVIPMFSQTPASVFTIADSEITEDGYWYDSSNFDLYAENRAGSWSNMVTINISSKKE